ncbi:MAG: Biopolymer transport protein ExbB, partial [Hydrocarboniphaga sp.]|nr:Biopolymer transport protein ExbB [Hydrocarboniphaga sp.]MDB5973125.1 Biopolymer transport protein ExbB [Hydrocarboniphaga sp.]
MEFFNHVIRFFQGGGAFMYPIALVLAMAAAVAIERMIFL